MLFHFPFFHQQAIKTHTCVKHKDLEFHDSHKRILFVESMSPYLWHCMAQTQCHHKILNGHQHQDHGSGKSTELSKNYQHFLSVKKKL